MNSLVQNRTEGLKLHQDGHLVEAESEYRKILDRHPDDGETWHYLAVLKGQLGLHAEVIDCCHEAIKHHFEKASVYANLGLALRATGQVKAARSALRKSLDMDADDLEITLEWVHVLLELGEEEAALAALVNALIRFGEQPGLHTEYGRLAVSLNEGGLAEEQFTKAVQLDGQQATHWLNLAGILQMRGKIESAVEAFQKTLMLDAECYQAVWFLSQIPEFEGRTRFEQTVLSFTDHADSEHAASMHFATGKIHYDADRRDLAFTAYEQGNKLVRQKFDYSVNRDVTNIRKLGTGLAWNPPAIETIADESTGAVPIFIVGMPRTGSTLLEQMLGRHSQVESGGEMVWLQRFVREAMIEARLSFPEQQHLLPLESLKQIRRRYRAALELRHHGATFLIDKLPANFLCLPTIRRIFPQSVIIHASRDLMETCWSCYRHLFSGVQQFAYDLTELAYYSVAVNRFMKTGRALWPEQVVEMKYESLIADPKSVLSSLFQHLRLEWEAACLNPELSGNIIQTASSVQVREGVASKPTGSASEYRAWLRPLADALRSAEADHND